MPPFSSIYLRRCLLILAVFLFWVLIVCFPAVHFEPGKGHAVKQGPQGMPPSLDFFAIFLLAVAAFVLITALIFVAQRIRKKRKKDDFPHELYCEPIPTPWAVYLVVALLFISVPAIVWLARHPSTPAESPALTEHASAPESMQPEKAGPSPPEPAAPNGEPLVAPILKYLLVLPLMGILTWIVLRHLRDRHSRLSGTLSGMQLRKAQLEMASEKDSDLSDAVLRCYRDMCRILTRKVGYPKEMTAREFARRCAQAGAPEREVSRMTELFEEVRYGRHVAGLEERNESIRLLQAVKRQQGEGVE